MKNILLSALVASLLLTTTLFAEDEKVRGEDATNEQVESKNSERSRDGERGRDGDKRRVVELSRRTIRTIDTDQDGKVSIEEYLAHGRQRFEALDLNGDNFVTGEEAKRASEEMRKNQNEARSALDKMKEKSSADTGVTETD